MSLPCGWRTTGGGQEWQRNTGIFVRVAEKQEYICKSNLPSKTVGVSGDVI